MSSASAPVGADLRHPHTAMPPYAFDCVGYSATGFEDCAISAISNAAEGVWLAISIGGASRALLRVGETEVPFFRGRPLSGRWCHGVPSTFMLPFNVFRGGTSAAASAAQSHAGGKASEIVAASITESPKLSALALQRPGVAPKLVFSTWQSALNGRRRVSAFRATPKATGSPVNIRFPLPDAPWAWLCSTVTLRARTLQREFSRLSILANARLRCCYAKRLAASQAMSCISYAF